MREWLGADAGSLGPVGVKIMRLVADGALEGRRNMIAGANQDDYHLRNVTPGEDFKAEFHDLRQAAAGDACMQLRRRRSSCARRSRSATFSSSATNTRSPWGCACSTRRRGDARDHGLLRHRHRAHPERGGRAAARQGRHGSAGGDRAVHGGGDAGEQRANPAQRRAAEEIYQTCLALGLDALLDDRDERPGVKFKDADLVGIPFRITVGKKLAQGMVELVERHGKKSSDVPVAEAAAAVNDSPSGYRQTTT